MPVGWQMKAYVRSHISLLVTEEQQVDSRTTCPCMEFEPMALCDLHYFIKA